MDRPMDRPGCDAGDFDGVIRMTAVGARNRHPIDGGLSPGIA